MKTTIVSILSFITLALAAAEPLPVLPIKGTLDIKYNSRATTPPAKGVKDVYTVNVNMANSALFAGTITDTPQIIDGWVSKSVVQPRALDYDINMDVVNPKNPAQTKNVGRLYGRVGIDPDGSYRYDNGSLTVDVLPIGNAPGFSSKYGGTALGKPLARPANWLDSLKCEAVNITRNVGGKSMTVALKKYDKMDFRQHVLGAGPVAFYQAVTVNGEMLYDYDKSCWFFNGVTLQYADAGTIKIDRLTGTIRFVEKTAEYQFDVRVNEPPPSASAAFETAAGDESAFFESDNTIPALTGKMLYKDTKKGAVTIASAVSIDLAAHNLNKQQAMALTKMILFSAVVPMNAD